MTQYESKQEEIAFKAFKNVNEDAEFRKAYQERFKNNPLTLQKKGDIMEQSQAEMTDTLGRKRRYNNLVGRLLYELMYGSCFLETKGLSRVISLKAIASQLQTRQSNIVEKLRYMEGMGILDTLHIDYKTVHLTLAAPVGVKKKEG